jgi:hypothetical protein
MAEMLAMHGAIASGSQQTSGASVKGHRYRITVEHLFTAKGEAVDKPPLVFEALNHDDLLAIAERVRTRPDIPPEDAAPLAIGLKLFGEVVLKHRKEPLFTDIQEALGSFIGKLKGTPR